MAKSYRPRKVVHSPYQLSLWDDVELERCATHIRADLGIQSIGPPPDFATVMQLVETHGGEPTPSFHYETGRTLGDVMSVNPHLPLSELSLVLLHELLHRLFHSERYLDLNPVRTSLPRREFLELLAIRVTGEMIH